MFRYILYFMFPYFLIHSGYSQCNSELIIDFQSKLSHSNTFSNFPYGSAILSGLTESVAYFGNDLDRKGILYKNRKISRSVICSQIKNINLLINEYYCLIEKINRQENEEPSESGLALSLNDLQVNERNTPQMQQYLDAVFKIEGVNSFFENQDSLMGYIEESANQNERRMLFFICYLFQKQKLDSAQFRFTLDYIPLLVEKQNLQNQLALELTSLATKLNLYQSKKYDYIKYL